MNNCPACGGRDATESHLRRCQIVTTERRAAAAYGGTYAVPGVTTDDLWAHLGHVASPQDATRIVRQVLDLGWRPVVGSDPKRLWRGRQASEDADLLGLLEEES